MSRHTIAFATSENVANGRTRWAKPIEAAWAGPQPPSFRAVGLETLVVELAQQGANPAAVGGATAALVVFGPTEQPGVIDRVIEALAVANVPAVCLMNDPAAWRPFQRQ